MRDNRQYDDEDVFRDARRVFIETIEIKMKHLRRYVPKGLNPTLTGNYVESVVRQFVRKWIGHRRLCSGTFCSKESQERGKAPMQIDGIVYDSHIGPLVLDEDDFIIVHPAF